MEMHVLSSGRIAGGSPFVYAVSRRYMKFDVHFVLSLGLGQYSTYPTGLSNFHLHNCTWVYKWKIRNYQNQSPIRMSTTTYLVLNLHVLVGFLEHRDSVFFLLQAQIFDSILDVPS